VAEPVVIMTPDVYFAKWYLTIGLLMIPYGIVTFFVMRWAIISAAHYLSAETAAKVASDFTMR
jgi:hypothetical protein